MDMSKIRKSLSEIGLKKACAVCQKPADISCGDCQQIEYCSVTHQMENWSVHKEECKPLDIETSDDPCETGGRNIVNCADNSIKKESLSELLDIRIDSPKADYNILILGETGVGKSTWINGFFNYLSFEHMQEAAENPGLLSLIPSEFSMTDENYEEIVISTGVDKNEEQKAGQSATQSSKVYPFRIGDSLIRIIDTPGIGDTRGPDKDRDNFQNILNTLSHLKELHGICVLLKPNSARLTVMFRFCIKELLTHLHRDAARNIMFCFTNARGTFYRPGDTLPALRNLLAENKTVSIPLSHDTIYCYDSESYRFLAALKNGVIFSEDETADFANSWERSVVETERMLERIKGLTPHPVQSTCSLNHARQLIITLTKPLANIIKNIQTNIAVIKDKKKEIQASNLIEDDLRKFLLVPKIDLKAIPLNMPRTVCTNSECIKLYDVGNGVKQNCYITLCHNPCYLTNVTVDTIGHHELINCHAMGGSDHCRHCSHTYKEHMHIMYETEEVATTIEDVNIKTQLDKNISDAQAKAVFIKNLEKRIEEYRLEQEEVEKANSRFGCFLKHNAITPYNDAMIEYLDHFIREEKEKSKITGSNEIWEGLVKTKEEYTIQFRILEEEMKKSGTESDLKPQNMDDLVKSLYALPHFGETLKKELAVAIDVRNNVGAYNENPVKMTNYTKKRSRNPKRLFRWEKKFTWGKK